MYIRKDKIGDEIYYNENVKHCYTHTITYNNDVYTYV